MKMNPNYQADKLGLDVVTIDEPDMSWEYNTLMFARPKGEKGRVYMAQDSGCSCPTPFEQWEGVDGPDVLRQMERVPDYQSARASFDAWNKGWDGKPFVSSSEFDALSIKDWFE